jgi:Protein of unknown function (DUF3619)
MNRQRPTSASSHASPLLAQHHSVQTRLGARIASALSLQAERLPHELTERLRFGREQALARAREVRARQVMPVGVTAGGAAVLAAGASWWQRTASVLPLIVLLAGLVMIDRWVTHEQVLTAADIDAQLLADDLPPAAYADPGFVEFLRSPPANP